MILTEDSRPILRELLKLPGRLGRVSRHPYYVRQILPRGQHFRVLATIGFLPHPQDPLDHVPCLAQAARLGQPVTLHVTGIQYRGVLVTAGTDHLCYDLAERGQDVRRLFIAIAIVVKLLGPL